MFCLRHLMALLLAIGAFALVPEHAAAGSVYIVDTTLDENFTNCGATAGDCSLRGAINNSNASAGGDTILFDLLVFPSLPPATIQLASGLPVITGGNVAINALGSGVTIDTAGEPGNFRCITLASDDNTVAGLHMTDCDTAIWIMSGEGNHVGVSNLFYDNSYGVYVSSDSNRVTGSLFGTNAGGNAVNPSGGNTVAIRVDGGDNTIEGNTISGNHDGIVMATDSATGNTVIRNHIGTNFGETADLGNTGAGINISHYFTGSAPTNNTIGGLGPNDGNVISGNTAANVFIADAGTTGNVVVGNIIGPDGSGTSNVMTNGPGVIIAAGAQDNRVGPSNMISDNYDRHPANGKRNKCEHGDRQPHRDDVARRRCAGQHDARRADRRGCLAERDWGDGRIAKRDLGERRLWREGRWSFNNRQRSDREPDRDERNRGCGARERGQRGVFRWRRR